MTRLPTRELIQGELERLGYGSAIEALRMTWERSKHGLNEDDHIQLPVVGLHHDVSSFLVGEYKAQTTFDGEGGRVAVAVGRIQNSDGDWVRL